MSGLLGLRLGVICTSLLSSTGFAAAQATDQFYAQTITVAFNFCPKGWADMNGQLLPINQNQALFSLLGTVFGGDGRTTFALPTAAPQFTANGIPLRQCIALLGIFPSRN